MSYSRLLLNTCLKNAVAYKVARRTLASEAHSRCGSADPEDTLTSHASSLVQKKTLILRVLQNKEGKWELTPEGDALNVKVKGKLKRFVDQLTEVFVSGRATVVTDVDIYEGVALSWCGPKEAADFDTVEGLNETKENIRCCYSGALQALNQLCILQDIQFETSFDKDHLIAAYDGYHLMKWRPSKVFSPEPMFETCAGVNGQNWARHLSQNTMTPEDVVQEAITHLCPLGNIVLRRKDKKFLETTMPAFFAVAQGSSVPPVLLECEYTGKEGAPKVLMVAKGVTSDSGGLCLKNREDMSKNSGMIGAAAALGTVMAFAMLKVPINVLLLVPLCENMISGHCLKVGDVVPTLKGSKIKIEDTDLEGPLMLADALTYGQKLYDPKYVMSVASLTPGITKATGGGCYGCFTKSDGLWDIARSAGAESGDRPWRFPIWGYYGKQITDDSSIFNLKNRGSGIASHCLGAAFLEKFVNSADNWLHYDITGVGKMVPGEAPVYLDPDLMTGRPTRALLETIKHFAVKQEEDL